MKILIFLFVMITFVLMASDPRRNDLETKDSSWQKNQTKDSINVSTTNEMEDSTESS